MTKNSSLKSTLAVSLNNYLDAGAIVAGSSGITLWQNYLGLSEMHLGWLNALSANAMGAAIGANSEISALLCPAPVLLFHPAPVALPPPESAVLLRPAPAVFHGPLPVDQQVWPLLLQFPLSKMHLMS